MEEDCLIFEESDLEFFRVRKSYSFFENYNIHNQFNNINTQNVANLKYYLWKSDTNSYSYFLNKRFVYSVLISNFISLTYLVFLI